MKPVVYLDTQAAARLHAGELRRITPAALQVIESGDLRISPMVYLEFDYLFRRKRIRFDAPRMFMDLNTTFQVQLCTQPFALIAAVATKCTWTDDPFDKLIVASAIASQNAPLITADEKIRQHYSQAVW